jgi:chromosome segregation ATPase
MSELTEAGTAVVAEPVEGGDGETAPVCALDGCDRPLPERPLDEQGRRRVGRRPRYCGKAHADQASRQRRAVETEAVTGPLRQAEELGRRVVPVGRELAGLLTELIARLDAADTGALARIATAETEVARARQEAAEAVDRRQEAEQARRSALTEARAAARDRDEAIAEAARVARDAEQVRTTAWEQVAAHERARGEAEATRDAAEAAVVRLSEELRAAQEERERERVTAEEVTARLREARQEADRARAEQVATREANTLLESARTQTLAERDRLLVEVERVRGELAGVSAAAAEEADRARAGLARSEREGSRLGEELGRERNARTLAEQRLADARSEAEEARRQAAQLQSLLMALRGPVD